MIEQALVPEKQIKQNNVIEILDDDDKDMAQNQVELETAVNEANDEEVVADMTSCTNISSHTSPACESALLALVQAPQSCNESGSALIDLAKPRLCHPFNSKVLVSPFNATKRYFQPEQRIARELASSWATSLVRARDVKLQQLSMIHCAVVALSTCGYPSRANCVAMPNVI
jgi:hypothetical protein